MSDSLSDLRAKIDGVCCQIAGKIDKPPAEMSSWAPPLEKFPLLPAPETGANARNMGEKFFPWYETREKSELASVTLRPQNHGNILRGDYPAPDYGEYNTEQFTIRLFYGGCFLTKDGNTLYEGSKVDYIDNCYVTYFSKFTLDRVMNYAYKRSRLNLNYGLMRLATDQHVAEMLQDIGPTRTFDMYLIPLVLPHYFLWDYSIHIDQHVPEPESKKIK
ncbi:Uncharacterized protein Fot_20265 [Forsythia ovata]|uniref:Uncharacterized protein n=1 Tax=Forsythia ovata TaxID=205694 RepID=A0ABD1VNE4_9LAMI